MTRYQFSITVTGTAINLATAAFAGTAGISYPAGWVAIYGSKYLPSVRLEVYMDVGSAGSGYVGPSNVATDGTNKAYVLPPPGAAGQMGGYVLIQSYGDGQTEDLASLWVNGSNNGDKIVVVYHQG